MWLVQLLVLPVSPPHLPRGGGAAMVPTSVCPSLPTVVTPSAPNHQHFASFRAPWRGGWHYSVFQRGAGYFASYYLEGPPPFLTNISQSLDPFSPLPPSTSHFLPISAPPPELVYCPYIGKRAGGGGTRWILKLVTITLFFNIYT